MSHAWEKHIKVIMDEFDFQQVRKVMVFLDWKWGFTDVSVPSMDQLRAEAECLLRGAIAELERRDVNQISLGSGGLEAEAAVSGRGNYLNLEFHLAEWDSFDELT